MNSNCRASGAEKSIDVNPTSIAGVDCLVEKTCTRKGRCRSPSTARRTWATRVVESLGVSTSSYAVRPATTTAGPTSARVVGSMAASAALAASSGVGGSPVPVGPAVINGPPVFPASLLAAAAFAGSMTRCVAVWALLDQIHTSLPLWMMSDSPSVPTRARRCWFSPPYQTFQVWLPLMIEVSSDAPAPTLPDMPLTPGRDGSPRSAVCTTVPDRWSRRARCRSASSSAAVRGARSLSAEAIRLPASETPATRTTAAAGTSQRPKRERNGEAVMTPGCNTPPERTLRRHTGGSGPAPTICRSARVIVSLCGCWWSKTSAGWPLRCTAA